MHLSMDPKMNIHALKMTTDRVDDRDVLDDLIPDDLNVEKFIADGDIIAWIYQSPFYTKGSCPL